MENIIPHAVSMLVDLYLRSRRAYTIDQVTDASFAINHKITVLKIGMGVHF